MHNRLRHAIDDIAAAGRAHQAGNANPLAALDEDLGQGQRNHQRAEKLGVSRERRSKHH